MKAMILAAGLGSRLKPITYTIPKALISVAGKPLLFFLIDKLKLAGVDEIIINVYHHAAQVIQYIEDNNNFDIRVEISREKNLLDTGGGLKKAAWFFDNNQPFILHNVDVISSIDLIQMLEFHKKNDALVTLAVKKRKSSRYLLFGQNNQLVGWRSTEKEKTEIVKAINEPLETLSFLGVHIVSPAIFPILPEAEVFPIIKAYLALAKKEKRIIAYQSKTDFWLDLGRKENLQAGTDYLLSKFKDKKRLENGI
jgi:NDP-sugar pyrophosphorylase family protein